MTEAVAVPKPGGKAKSGSGKTAFAGVLVLVLLAAFAVAFYFLGGVELVSGLVSGLFAEAPQQEAPAPSTQKPAAAVPTTGSAEASGTGLTLPDGVDEAFAKRIYAEQIESQENIGKLVAGDIVKFEFGAATTTDDKAAIPLVATFKDQTSGPGQLVLAKKAGKWYLETVAGEAGSGATGLAASVARDTVEDTIDHIGKSLKMQADEAVLNAMLEQQSSNQEIISGIVDGTFTDFTVDGIKPGTGTVTLEVTFNGSKAAAMKGRVLCISKDIDGKRSWFITSFTKA